MMTLRGLVARLFGIQILPVYVVTAWPSATGTTGHPDALAKLLSWVSAARMKLWIAADF